MRGGAVRSPRSVPVDFLSLRRLLRKPRDSPWEVLARRRALVGARPGNGTASGLRVLVSSSTGLIGVTRGAALKSMSWREGLARDELARPKVCDRPGLVAIPVASIVLTGEISAAAERQRWLSPPCSVAPLPSAERKLIEAFFFNLPTTLPLDFDRPPMDGREKDDGGARAMGVFGLEAAKS